MQSHAQGTTDAINSRLHHDMPLRLTVPLPQRCPRIPANGHSTTGSTGAHSEIAPFVKRRNLCPAVFHSYRRVLNPRRVARLPG
jgi:hypothetical protein